MASRLTSLRAAAALLVFSSLVACSKKSDDVSPNTPAAATGMAWTVDGAAASAPLASTQAFGTSLIISGLSGNTTNGTSVQLIVPTQTGTFAVGGSGTTAATAVYAILNGDSYRGTTGNVVVTTYTPSTTAGASVLVGTFSFTGATSATPPTTKTITNGTFNVKY